MVKLISLAFTLAVYSQMGDMTAHVASYLALLWLLASRLHAVLAFVLTCAAIFLQGFVAAAIFPAILVAHSGIVVGLMIGGRLLGDWPSTFRSRDLTPWYRQFSAAALVIGAVLALTSGLVRFVPFAELSFVAVSFAAIGIAGLRRYGRAPKTKPLLLNGSLLVVSLLISLALLEIGIRLALPTEPVSLELYMPDPAYLFMLKPNARSYHQIPVADNESAVVPMSVSSQALRDREYGEKESGEFRILMLGDSFTMGHAVQIEESISRFLEHELSREFPNRKVTVINGGIGGGGPLQYLGMLRQIGVSLEPDLVILQLFPQNDIENSLEVVRKRQRAYDIHWQRSLEVYYRLNEPPYRAERWVSQRSRVYRTLKNLTGNTPWLANFLATLRFFPQTDERRLPPSDDRPFFLEVDLQEWYPELEEGMELFKQYIGVIREECAARDIPLLAYCIPDLHGLYDEPWQKQVRNSEAAYERGKGVRLVNEFLKREGIPFVSVDSALRRGGRVEEMYYPLDGHLTARGNRVVALVLKDYLLNEMGLNLAGIAQQ